MFLIIGKDQSGFLFAPFLVLQDLLSETRLPKDLALYDIPIYLYRNPLICVVSFFWIRQLHHLLPNSIKREIQGRNRSNLSLVF